MVVGGGWAGGEEGAWVMRGRSTRTVVSNKGPRKRARAIRCYWLLLRRGADGPGSAARWLMTGSEVECPSRRVVR